MATKASTRAVRSQPSFEIEGEGTADPVLIVRMPLAIEPEASKSGKSRLAASTRGLVRIPATYLGAPVSLSLNATIPLD